MEAGGIKEYTSVQMGAFMQSHDVDDNLAFGEVQPVIRGIYDQNLSVSGMCPFAFLFSFAILSLDLSQLLFSLHLLCFV